MISPSPAGSAPDAEFQAMVREKYAGNPAAITALAVRVIAGRDAPRSLVDGAALLDEAARQGDAAAHFRLASLHAAGAVNAPCWHSAWNALVQSRTAGHAPAARQLDLLTQENIHCVDDIQHWIAPPAFRTVHADPALSACKNFISPAWCEHLTALATPLLEAAKVYDYQQKSLKLDPMRTNRNAALSVVETDVIVQLIRARIAQAAQVTAPCLEPPEVLHYAPGEQYRLHVDFFHVSVPHFAEIVRDQGQRTKTLLIYLNTDYAGGATEFPKLDMRFRGEKGEALLFENVDVHGEGDMRTAHCGTPVTSGSKWLFSQWIRNKAQPTV